MRLHAEAGDGHHWLVCYDVSDDRSRRRVRRLLLMHGAPVQFSAIQCVLSPRQISKLRAQLSEELDPHTDSVLFYPMPSPKRAVGPREDRGFWIV
jgi:CRISPR-associated protein Cas2